MLAETVQPPEGYVLVHEGVTHPGDLRYADADPGSWHEIRGWEIGRALHYYWLVARKSTMNPERLRQIANKVNEDKAAKALQEKEEQERQKQEAEKALEDQRLLEWPKYIEDKIEEAAAQGESSYEFEVGDCGERVLSELFIHFASLNPSTSWALRKQVINYDMGTYQEYSIKVVTFRW